MRLLVLLPQQVQLPDEPVDHAPLLGHGPVQILDRRVLLGEAHLQTIDPCGLVHVGSPVSAVPRIGLDRVVPPALGPLLAQAASRATGAAAPRHDRPHNPGHATESCNIPRSTGHDIYVDTDRRPRKYISLQSI